jgi:bifunctional N-acetylglutamate synthase/kinase
MSKSKPSMPAVLEPAEAVLRFLASVGPNSEAEFYLRLFRSRAPESFAALSVPATAVEDYGDGVVLDLRFLNGLGLTPVVVIGLHDPDPVARHLRELHERLVRGGLRAQLFATDSPPAAIAAAAADAVIPLLEAAGEGPDDRLATLARLLSALKTHKLIFLHPRGGFGLFGEQTSVINLSADYAALRASAMLDEAAQRLLDDSRQLIFQLVAHPLLVTVTSPLDLLHELFTVKGAGTLLRKGARIIRHDGYTGIDTARLGALLTSSFGKAPRADLFERPMAHVYVEEDYRGGALVAQTHLGGYLSKFAVTREAQGEGIGQDLWTEMIADHSALFWRARADNPVRAWYERQCQARFDSGSWTVYMRGIPQEKISEAIGFALGQPVDF